MHALNAVKISPNQERYIVAELATKHSFALPKSRWIEGNLDIRRLRSCLQKIINAHETLRIQLHLHTLDHITQSVHAPAEVALDYVELSNASHEEISARIASYFYAENSLFDQPLYKFQLIRVGHEQNIFTYSLHHVIADGVSIQLFVKELNACWQDESYCPTPSQNYISVLNEHRLGQLSSEENQALAAFWKQYLSDAPQASIPNDYSDTSSASKNSKVSRLINSSLVSNTQALAKSYNVSIFNVLYACFLIVLSRHAGEQDICTSFQSAGRQDIPDGKNLFGLFSCALLLRQKLEKHTSATELIQKIRQNVHACISHQRYPYHYVMKETGTQAKYAINWYPVETKLVLDNLSTSSYPWEVQWSSGFDLNLHCLQEADSIRLNLYYQQAVHDENRMHILLQQFEYVLTQILQNPQCKIADITLLSAEDQTNRVLPLVPKQHGHVLQAFLKNVSQFPDKVAIEHQQKSCTYAVLNDISAQLGHHLLSRGVKAQAKVAIIANRCPSMVAAILATSRVGASFAVLDAAYPNDRLESMLTLIQADHIVICGSPENLNTALLEANKVTRISENLDISDQIFAAEIVPAETLPQHNNSQDIAYYLFTSGTTGIPKCIAVSHSPLCHFVQWQASHFALDHNDRFTLLSGVSHDPVLRDIFTPLSIGASIMIPDQRIIHDPGKLFTWFAECGVTVSHLTPPMTKIIHAGLSKNTPLYDLRYLFTGGDMLQKSHVRDIRQFAPEALLINFYGTTETPQAMAYHCIDYDDINKKIPIGKGISDVQVLILNEQSQRAGLYEQGQVVIRTNYLSEGYIGSPQNSPNFSNDIFSNDPDTRLYFTGDYGYYNSDYKVVLLGRQDDQIKIRGYRIELNEINQAILNHSPETEDAITIATEFQDGNDGSQEKQLVTYVVKKTGANITINTLHALLSRKLPGYMIPGHIMLIDSLPLLPNGKIDRRKLPPPNASSHIIKADGYEIPETETENEIALAWGGILDGIEVGRNHSFVNLGGDSLSHIQASLVLEKILGHIPDEWESKPISELAVNVKTPSGWIEIDSTVLVRAISICMVVTTHFMKLGINGATSALFMVAGYTFAKYQLKTIQMKNSSRPIISTLIAIVIPTTIINLIHMVYRDHVYLPMLFLFDNLIVPNSSWWFIEVLVQILIVLAALLSFKKIRDIAAGENARQFSIILLFLAGLLAIIMQTVWNTDHLHNMVPQQKIWIFFFGWFIYFSLTENKIIPSLILAIVLPSVVTGKIDYMLTLGALMITLSPKVKIPVSFYKPIYIVAASSLIIYLTHMQIKNGFIKLGFELSPGIQIIIGIIGGILIQQAWEKLRLFKRKLLHQ